jgi:hypothetical protein
MQPSSMGLQSQDRKSPATSHNFSVCAWDGALSLMIHGHFQRASRRSTFGLLLPTFLTAFFTAAFDRPDFFDSYLTS